MSSKTPDWMPELFFCHRHEFAMVADVLGFRIGTRSDEVQSNRVERIMDDGVSIDFVDNNFKDPDRERLERVVTQTDPEFTVLPDVYDKSDLRDIVSFGQTLVD